MTSAIECSRKLVDSANAAHKWFVAETTAKTFSEYMSKGTLGDAGKGAVYVYFDQDQNALYVGETGRAIKRRMHDKTSPHKGSRWWKKWTHVRLLPMPNRTDRLAMELLLVLALQPPYNTKPGARLASSLFSSEA